MDFLTLFWKFDANNSTKMFVFILFVICLLCIICKPKSKNKKENFNNNMQYGGQKMPTTAPATAPTKCEIDFKVCQENQKRGNKNDMCFRCMPNGDYPPQIYHPNAGWVKIDPKSGKFVAQA